MVGCNKANNVKVYKNDIPIYNENNTISIAELDNIYEKFNSGFGGNELFKYLMKKEIIRIDLLIMVNHFCIQL